MEMEEKEIRGLRNPDGSDTLARGGTGCVFTFPDKPGEVLKMPWQTKKCKEMLAIEKRIYRHLGPHPHIVRCLNADDDELTLRLERAEPGCIRAYFKEGGTATLQERITWSRDLADTLQHLHDKDVYQIDIAGRNILLDKNRNIFVCDFSGSRIDGYEPTIIAQEGFGHPDWNERHTLRNEIHALGSSIMELMTGHWPYKGLEFDVDIDKWHGQGLYPDVSAVKLGDVMIGCWESKYTSAGQVADRIRERLAEMDSTAEGNSYANGDANDILLPEISYAEFHTLFPNLPSPMQDVGDIKVGWKGKYVPAGQLIDSLRAEMKAMDEAEAKEAKAKEVAEAEEGRAEENKAEGGKDKEEAKNEEDAKDAKAQAAEAGNGAKDKEEAKSEGEGAKAEEEGQTKERSGEETSDM